MPRGDDPAVLVALDGSQPEAGQLAVAEAVARLYDADVHILHASAEAMTPTAIVERTGVPDEWRTSERVHHRDGDAARAIIDEARAQRAAAIVMCSHGETADPEVIAGHVTLEVLERTPCPVVVTRAFLDMEEQAARMRNLRRLLVPLDGTAEAAQACEHAVRLATRCDARLLMLHVLARAARQKAPAFPRYVDHAPYELEAWRQEFAHASLGAAELPSGVQAEVALRVGDPADEIVSYAAAEDCDLVVVAWGGHITRHRALIVRKLLTASPCPLLFLLSDAKRAG